MSFSYLPCTVTESFFKQLKSLRLNEYPCIGGKAPVENRNKKTFTKSKLSVEKIILDKKFNFFKLNL